jgi:phosphohistidine phosphatase
MRTLVLMRHATAGMGPAGSDDRDRIISARGHEEADHAGVWLRAHSLGPRSDRLVLASAAVRARETAEHLGGPLSLEPHLYNATEGTLLEAVRYVEADPNTVVLVAHNPGIHRLAWWLGQTAAGSQENATTVARDGASRPEPLSSFAPATMAIFTVSVAWPQLAPGHAELRQVIRPTTR